MRRLKMVKFHNVTGFLNLAAYTKPFSTRPPSNNGLLSYLSQHEKCVSVHTVLFYYYEEKDMSAVQMHRSFSVVDLKNSFLLQSISVHSVLS